MKSFFRFLLRNPLYTLINVVGLAVALMFVILIGDYAWRQFSADASQPNKDRIVLMGNSSGTNSWPRISHGIGELYPEIEKTCCVVSQGGTIRTEDRFLEDEDRSIMMLVDSTFFDMFEFRFTEGDPGTALSSPDRCVITESLAGELFPDGKPLGMTLRLAGQRSVIIGGRPDPYDSTLVYMVSGVIPDFDRTVFPSDTRVIVPMERHPQVLGYEMSTDVWVSTGHGSCKTFYMLEEGADLSPKAGEIKEYVKRNVSARFFDETDAEYSFIPLRELMFSPVNDGMGLEKGDKGLVGVLLSAIMAILLFAVTNYINLTVANTGIRAREMATRRLLGSDKKHIFFKLISESLLMVSVAFLLGLLLAFVFQDDMAAMFRGKIMLAEDAGPGTLGVCAAFVLCTGILSGVIPGMQISAFNPIDVVKGSFRYRSKMLFSRIFIMLQNLITVVMLTASFVIMLQIKALVNAPLGFNAGNVVVVRPDDSHEAVRETLSRLPCVEKMGRFRGTCLLDYSATLTQFEDIEGNAHLVYTIRMDRDAMDIYGLELVKDYGVSPDAPYVNEELCRQLGLAEDAREIVLSNKRIPVSGVLKDFRKVSVLNDYASYMIYLMESEEIEYPNYLVLTDGSPDAIRQIEDAVGDVMLEMEPGYSVLELDTDIVYSEERNVMHIVLMFTAIAVLISVLGFICMSIIFIRQRRREIAVRRIMGGSVNEIILFLLVRFCAPLLVSAAVAVPVAYGIMGRWLENFSYRIKLGFWIFAVTAAASILIAVLSVLWQIVATVRVDPAESIKTE